MLSRVADAIFWMNRYIERAENVARFLDVNQNLSLGFHGGYQTQWEPLIRTTGDLEKFTELYDEEYSQHNVVRFLTFDENNPNSIVSCLKLARENARRVRDNLSVAMWEAINKCYLRVKEFSRKSSTIDNVQELLDLVKEQSQLIVGACETTLSHSDAWNISRLGRFIERADKTSRIVDVKYYILLPRITDVGGNLDVVQWAALLNSASGLQMYRRKYGRIDPDRVVEFLLLDREFPRSMHFCLIHAEIALRSMTGSQPTAYSNRAEQLLGQIKSRLNYASVRDIINGGLHEFVDSFQLQLNELGEEIHAAFYGEKTAKQSQTQQQSSFSY